MLRRISVTVFIFLRLLPMIYGDECHCHCDGQVVCHQVHTNTKQLDKWEKKLRFLEIFEKHWENEILKAVKEEMEKYISEGKFSSMLENMKKAPAPRKDLDNLVVKVEGIENRTLSVEEGLQRERRVRRHLEQEMNETRSSLASVGNQIAPLDAMMNRVQMTMNSTLKDMNETLYENHLKKLYYKVDGMTHKNETNGLIQRLRHVESELRDSVNNSIFFKLSQDLQTTKENFHHLNNSMGDTVMSLTEALNNSIKSILVPRIEVLEAEAVPKDTVKELEEKMTDLFNVTELRLNNAELDVKSSIINIQSNSLKATEFRRDLDNLQTGLKIVENRTDKVEEENKRERPLKRQLQQELRRIHSSLISISDRVNATLPVDAMMNRVQMVINSSLEAMNETLYENPLKILYSKVDGVAYKHELNDLIERLENVETELRHGVNISVFSRHTEDLNMTMENLNNNLFSVSSDNRKLNNSIESIVIPRIEMLEKESNRKVTVEELEEKMKNVFNDTELVIKCHLMDLWSSVKNNQNLYPDTANSSESVEKEKHLTNIVTCPAFNMLDIYEIVYHSTPTGDLRAVGTTAEFICQQGHTVVTQCMPDGNWSRDIPSPEECSLRSIDDKNRH